MAKTDLPESPFVWNTRTGKGYDSDILTVRGATWEEFRDNVRNVLSDEEWEERIELFANTPKDDQPSSKSSSSSSTSSSGDWKHNAPGCEHGTMNAREWTDKNNKKQHTYFCCLEKDDPRKKCTPIDAITGKKWGEK